MEKNNGLLPFAFSTASAHERHALSTDPREKHVIDENAHSMYHTRGRPRGPQLLAMPSIKRKMGESFTEKDDVKRREHDFFFGGLPPAAAPHDPPTDATEPDLPSKDPHEFPSSPPAPQPSELDVSVSSYTVPDSPVFAVMTSPVRKPKVHSSEPDFGIDLFNRFKASSFHQCPSTDPVEEPHGDNYDRARATILQAFEDVNPKIVLDGMHLTEIPDEVKDLDNLVIFERPTQHARQLYLSNNSLTVLNPALFRYRSLNVLSLRQNMIRELPGLIGELQNLTDLNLSINKLKYLPPQILSLPRLLTFRAGPNPFLEVAADATEVSEENPRFLKGLRWVSSTRHFHAKQNVPTLKNFCLDVIANYDVTYQETKSWKHTTPKLFHSIIALAITKGRFSETCDRCSMVLVEPYADIIEWWDILQNTNVPIKRRFCSGLCVGRYHSRTAF